MISSDIVHKVEDKVNILLVDDRPENLLALEAILERLEQNLIKANSGEEALNYLLDHDFALILLDVQMPVMDGFETAKIIHSREKSRNIPIIFLTAINRTDKHVAKGYSVGAVDYIFKPFEPEILLSKVKVFIELYKKNQELKCQLEAYKELESFTYSVSHDLRAPLRLIKGFAELLDRRYSGNLDQDGLSYLDLIINQTRQMNQLIDDLLNFSRVNQKEVDKVDLSVYEMVNMIIDELKKLEPERNIDIKIDQLPAAKADKSLIKQVFVNLISNAFKYTKNKNDAKIYIGFSENNNEIIYFVEDNGVGFDMKYSKKLFEVFQRLHSDAEFEGSGIGLAIVKRIILKHGGRVYAEAKLNQGARFSFCLPKY